MLEDTLENIDYFVSAVKYDISDTKIKRVTTHEKKDQYGVGNPYEEAREDLVESIKKGAVYYTLVKNSDGEFDYNVGKKIEMIEVDGEDFLRTDSKEMNEDFLEDLQKINRLDF